MSRCRAHALLTLASVVCVALIADPASAAKKRKKRAPHVEAAKTEAPKPEAPKPEAAKPEQATDFDRQAAITAITQLDLQKCKATNAARGEGHVMITFDPAGTATSAVVDKGPMVGTPTAKCLVAQFKKAKVPSFKGGAVTVGKSFQFD
jgi:hypothetical protein